MHRNPLRKATVLINLAHRGWIIQSARENEYQVVESSKVMGVIDQMTFRSIRPLLVERYCGDKRWWSLN
jgi:hypothetical protein